MNFINNNQENFRIHLYTILIKGKNTIFLEQMPTKCQEFSDVKYIRGTADLKQVRCHVRLRQVDGMDFATSQEKAPKDIKWRVKKKMNPFPVGNEMMRRQRRVV
jgi:hypothetical protein